MGPGDSAPRMRARRSPRVSVTAFVILSLVSRASSRGQSVGLLAFYTQAHQKPIYPVMDPFPRAHSILTNAFIAKTRHPKVKIEEYAHRHHGNRLGRGIALGSDFGGCSGSESAARFSAANSSANPAFPLFDGRPNLLSKPMVKRVLSKMTYASNRAFLKFSLPSGKPVSQSRHHR